MSANRWCFRRIAGMARSYVFLGLWVGFRGVVARQSPQPSRGGICGRCGAPMPGAYAKRPPGSASAGGPWA
jgi:hypothetical protein